MVHGHAGCQHLQGPAVRSGWSADIYSQDPLHVKTPGLTGSASGADPVAAEKAVLATTSAAAAICSSRRVGAESEGEKAWGLLYCPSKPASTAPWTAGFALSHAMSEPGGIPGLLGLALATLTCTGTSQSVSVARIWQHVAVDVEPHC